MKSLESEYYLKEIDDSYNEEMLSILSENPIESSGLRISFDRNPDIFKKSKIKYKSFKYVGFFKENKLYGFASIGFYRAYICGEPESVFYCSDAYLRKSARKKGFIKRASEVLFYEAQKNSNWGYLIFLKGNKNVERFISKYQKRGLKIPSYKKIGTFEARNIIITFKKKESKRYKIRKATMDDSSKIVSLLKDEFTNRMFAPYIDKNAFEHNLLKRPDFGIENYYVAEKNEKIVGVCAAWDCSSFKQTRVLRYGKQYLFTKVLYSILSRLFNFPDLPRQGNVFRDVYIVDYAVKERDHLILNALLTKIYNDYRKLSYNTLIFGSYKRDILFKALKGFFNQSIKSHIIAFSYDKSKLEEITEETSMPYIDTASL